MKAFVVLVFLLLGLLAALVISIQEAPTLGPTDGFDLPPTDVERVALGTEAPDFSLLAYSEDILTLSDYRGDKNVVLVFYRGHW